MALVKPEVAPPQPAVPQPASPCLTPQPLAPLRLTARAARGRRKLLLLIGVAALAVAVSAYALTVAAHPAGALLGGYDLRVYHDAGLITRHHSATLYSWQLAPGIRAVTVWMTFGALGWPGRARLGIVCAIGAVTFWTEPVQRTLHLGQVELLLMVLVVWDLRQPSRRWWQGAGIGLAAGIKLVPLIFIPYLVLTGRFRQATVAVTALAVTVAAGWAVLPAASAAWWLGPDFLRAGRTGFVGFVANQSLRGVITRLAGDVNAATPAWLAISAATFVLGLTAAALLHHSGRPAQGWAACALTGLLVSPVSWDHHWVWIAPILAVLADQAVRARGVARWSGWALLATVALLFGAWPSLWRSHAPLVPWGLIWYAPGTHAAAYSHVRPSEYHWHGLALLAGDGYILAGLVLFAMMVGSAALAWRPDR